MKTIDKDKFNPAQEAPGLVQPAVKMHYTITPITDINAYRAKRLIEEVKYQEEKANREHLHRENAVAILCGEKQGRTEDTSEEIREKAAVKRMSTEQKKADVEKIKASYPAYEAPKKKTKLDKVKSFFKDALFTK